jgi:EmrB/QacA subfamily drug resistance transporter
MLTSTVTVPIYGRLGDVHGRRPLLLVSISIFLVGSALCGLAQGMTELIVFRAVQGIGAGGLFPLSLAVIGSIVPARERGRWQGLIGAVFAASSILGPAIGGFIVDNTTWRWVFLVNLPIAGIALVVISLTMPRRAVRAEHAIDWLGAGLLAAGTAALLLGLVWGGREYAWSSAQVLGALAISAVALAAFALVERRAAEPILPFELLRNPIVAGSVACMALIGMAMFGTVVFAPLFVQGVIGTSATSSGVVLTPLLLGAVVTSLVTGQLIARTGRYRWNVVLGPPVLAVGMGLLWQMDADTTAHEAARNMVIAGIGIGAMMQVFVVSIQNAVSRARIGSATALGTFSRQIGATVGVTVMGVIVNHGLPAGATAGDGIAVHRPPPGLREALAAAITPAFFAATVAALLVWMIAVLWVKEVPLRRTVDDAVVSPTMTPPSSPD